MIYLHKNLTLTKYLWGSDWFAPIILCYIFLGFAELVTLVSIVEIDNIEINKRNTKYLNFRKKQFYIIQKSKDKHHVCKKTFILNIRNYCVILTMLIGIILSFFVHTTTSLIILGIVTIIVFTYGIIIGQINRTSKAHGPLDPSGILAKRVKEQKTASKSKKKK